MPSPIAAGSGSASASTVVQTPEVGPPPGPPVVTIEPVYIEGDAGVRQLVSQHQTEAARRDCLPQTRDATTSSLALVAGTLGAAAAIATGGTGLVIAGCLVGLFGLSIDAGAKIDDLKECKKP
jgi:hypothetical protein